MRKISALILALILIASFNLSVFAAAGDDITGFVPATAHALTAEGVYLKNLDTGDILYTKNIDKKIFPASLSKIMTVVLAFENTPDINNTIVKYPIEIQDYLYTYSLEHGGISTGGLVAGEERTMKEFIYACMLPSANEAAMSVALHLGGSIDDFAVMMNARAKGLGMNNTNFTNPTGLFHEDNYTTVRDLVTLTEHAFTIDGFMDIAEIYKYEAGPSNLQDSLTWVSTIELQNPELKQGERYYYDGIKGVKTGTLPESGHNYISTIEKDGFRYMLVLVGCTPIEERPAFIETKEIYDWVFSSIRKQTLVGANEVVGEITVNFAKDFDFVQLETADFFTALIPDDIILSGDGAQIEKILDIPNSLDAPIKKGDVVGSYVIKLLGEEVGRVDLVAKSNLQYSANKKILYNIKNTDASFWIKVAVGIALFLFVIYIIMLIIRQYNKRKKYKAFRTKRNRKK